MSTKSEARAARRAELDPVRERRRAERRCFWEWPWGHVWKVVDVIYGKGGGVDRLQCQSCGKTKASFWP